MTEVSKPEPVDTSHKDPAFAAQATNVETQPEPAQEAPTEEVDAEDGEQNESEQSAATETDDAKESQASKPRGVQKRLDELTRLRHEAQREAEHWREMAMRNQPKNQPRSEPSIDIGEEPTLENRDFDVERYTKDWAKWDREREAKQAAQVKAQQAAAERQQKFQQDAAAFAAQHPDFHQLVNSPYLRITDAMVEAITESDAPAAVAYHLAKNPQEAEKIAGLSAAGIGRAIAKIESQLSSEAPRQPTQKTVTNAPPPPTTLSGNKTPTKKLEEMTMAEYAAHRTQERQAKGLRP